MAYITALCFVLFIEVLSVPSENVTLHCCKRSGSNELAASTSDCQSLLKSHPKTCADTVNVGLLVLWGDARNYALEWRGRGRPLLYCAGVYILQSGHQFCIGKWLLRQRSNVSCEALRLSAPPSLPPPRNHGQMGGSAFSVQWGGRERWQHNHVCVRFKRYRTNLQQGTLQTLPFCFCMQPPPYISVYLLRDTPLPVSSIPSPLTLLLQLHFACISPLGCIFSFLR